MLYTLQADRTKPTDEEGYTGRLWLASVARLFSKAPTNPFVHLDLSNIRMIGLFEWISFLALTNSWAMRYKSSLREIGLDFVGGDSECVVTKEECIQKSQGIPTKRIIPDSFFKKAEQRRRLLGFVECLGTTELLSAPESGGVPVIYPFLGRNYGVPVQYVNKSDPTVLGGIQPIRDESDCRKLLQESQLQQWKAEMAAEFSDVPFFASNELWRCFFFELSCNIVEHVNNKTGFLSGRVVRKNSFPVGRLGVWPKGGADCVELCVADAGPGIATTLKEAFETEFKGETVTEDKCLIFAFGPRGSRKLIGERFLRCRHALARILSKVEKYAGILRVRSGNWELTYDFSTGTTIQNASWGPQPTHMQKLTEPIPGTHLQMILPLHPGIVATPDVHQQILPSHYEREPLKPIGHLIPLSERLSFSEACINLEDFKAFDKACSSLVEDLVQNNVRPDHEAFVLDCSDLGAWRWEQFAGMLARLQFALVGRPILVVEAPEDLVVAILDAELGGYIENFASVATDQIGHLYDFTVWCVDTSGTSHILGLQQIDSVLRPLLLALLDCPQTIEELSARCSQPIDAQARLRAIMPKNPLFRESNGVWHTFWSKEQLEVEASRAVTVHFSQVALRSVAWRGCPSKYKEIKLSETDKRTLLSDDDTDVFCLPWKGTTWVEEFLECRRIFARERQVDEIAQRLVNRIKFGMTRQGKDADAVGVLAVSTAPALMLATAMHKWWPNQTKPCVVDLGYQLLRAPEDPIPAISGSGEIVIVQDVLDDHSVTTRLIQKIAQHHCTVAMVVSFVRFEDSVQNEHGWSLVPPMSGWGKYSDKMPDIFRHSMFLVQRPKTVIHTVAPSDEHSYWIDPHSLRPFKYSDLISRSERWEKQLHHFLPEGDSGIGNECIIRAGHFAYGTRHYGVTVDVRSFFLSQEGELLAAKIAELCCGKKVSDWPCPLNGDVTMVIMPLHSQIHYLWHKVENHLARMGKRTFSAFVEAALFLGHGPAYRFSEQIQAQIERAAMRRGAHNTEPGMRVLVLDDAAISGKTIETILDQLHSAASRIVAQIQKDGHEAEWPFDWMRALVVFGEMPHTSRNHWRSLDHIGRDNGTQTRFMFSDLFQVPGLPVYDASSCSLCRMSDILKKFLFDRVFV